jgi:hypothetical protein
MVIFILYFSLIFIFCNCDNESYLNKEYNENISGSNKLNNYLEINNTAIKEGSKRKLQSKEPIRIEIVTDCIRNQLTADAFKVINESMIKAKTTLEKLINITRLPNGIILSELSDLGNKLDDFGSCINKDERINADLVIYIRRLLGQDEFKTLRPENSTLISDNFYAKPNIVHLIGGRPVIGTLIFNDHYNLPDNEKHKKELLYSIFLHEFTHILGFTRSMLPNNISKTIDVNSRINGKKYSKSVVVSSTVYERARKYFNCQTLTSIELSSIISAGDLEDLHWEARILLGDYMISEIYYPEQVISEFTLALLDSFSFYEVNYYTGGLMNFGKNKGCEFFEKDCVTIEGETSIISSFRNEFCSSYEKKKSFGTCSSGRQSMGYCFNQYAIESYFDEKYKRNYEDDKEPMLGFGKEFVEYCPLTYEYDSFTENTKMEYYNGNCYIGEGQYGNGLTNNEIYKTYSNSLLGEYSNISFCAMSSILKKDETISGLKNLIRPTCYKMYCSSKSLTIQIKDEFIVCPRSGGLINIADKDSNYIGYLYCPDYYLICSGTEICNNIYDCVEKQSMIKPNANNFSEYSNKNISIDVQTNDATKIKDITIEELVFERSKDGICPQNCSQCNQIHQCIKCYKDYNNYVGTKENDKEPINCYAEPPKVGYYINETYRSGKKYFFRCIENCNVCNKTKEKCDQCAPTHKLNGTTCTERIPGCKDYNPTYSDYLEDNGFGLSYLECENCNNSANYFCYNMDKKNCMKIDDYNDTLYFKMENKNYSCVKKCEEEFSNCLTCNKSTCILCNQTHHLINNRGNCVEIIDHCQEQRLDVDYPECNKCDISNSYYCVNNNKTKCVKIEDIIHYYKINSGDAYSCVSNCNETSHCLKCNYKDDCTECEDNYFVQGGKCYPKIEGCKENVYDGNEIECEECDVQNNYICINNDRKKCHKIENINYYYPLPDNNKCYNSCDTLVDNCLICNQTHCLNCTEHFDVNNNLTYCTLRPFEIPSNDNCTVRIHDYSEKSIFNLDFWDFIDYYWANNIPYIKVVDHFIGDNYTATIYINSDCTEDLLNQKYFQIDSKKLHQIMVKESNTEGMRILFTILINYNKKNHLRFHNLESKFLNPSKKCPSCFDTNYTFINNYYDSLNNALGPVVANVLISEKVDIVEKDSKVFKDFCNNVTFNGIDLPLRKRLKNIYLHKYTDPIFCRAENCTVIENDYEKIAATCNCKYGNAFEDILKGEKFEFTQYEGEEIKANNFADSFGIIKCSINGFKANNIKANVGFFLCIICLVSQICLYIYYSLRSKPIVNIVKNIHNPPKKAFLIMNTDWVKELKDVKNKNENEIYVQPRDDAEDQLLEEEKSYNNEDIFNTSSLSIDTNVGGVNIKNVNTADKLAIKEKTDTKKVIILLSKNKNKNKVKGQLITDDVKSDSDIIPLSDEYKKEYNLNFIGVYWSVVSLKQHIINFFSSINCCRITESYIPLSIRVIRSLFIFILSFVLNILWLNHSYYEQKFDYFNKKYIIIKSETEKITIPTGEKINYAISNTFGKAMISFILEIVIEFLIGFIFFSIRNNVLRAKRKSNLDGIQTLILKTRHKYLIFFIINIVLMIIFFFAITGFGGAYGGGFVDYFTAGLISLFFLEIFPFLWSIVLSLLRYYGFKKNNILLFKISQFFMF